MPPAVAQIADTADQLDGMLRAAILLMYLDHEVARNVLEHLGIEDLREIGVAMSKVDEIEATIIENVVAQFVIDLHRAAMVPTTGPQFALSVYPTLLPSGDRRRRVEGSLRRTLSTEFPDYIASRPAATIAAVLADEHPQSQAVAMLLMGDDNAARVMAELDEKERMEMVLRMARIETIPGELADEVERSMLSALSDQGVDSWQVHGLDRAAKIIGQLDRESIDELLDEINSEDSDLSDLLRRRMVVFIDLKRLPDRAIQTLLKNVERETLVLALRGATPDMRTLFLSNMSTRAGQDLVDEIDLLGPVPRTNVTKAQEQIVETAMRLAEDGALQLPTGGADQEMV